MKILVPCFLLILIGTGTSFGQSSDWQAPSSVENLKNPLSSTEEVIKAGKKLYKTMCVVCHGEKGKGDGVAGVALKPTPTNLTTPTFHTQSDGAIYWKVTEGRTPMASYKATLSDEQRWQLVTYIRALKR